MKLISIIILFLVIVGCVTTPESDEVWFEQTLVRNPYCESNKGFNCSKDLCFIVRQQASHYGATPYNMYEAKCIRHFDLFVARNNLRYGIKEYNKIPIYEIYHIQVFNHPESWVLFWEYKESL